MQARFDEWYGIPNSSDETVWEALDGYAESGVGCLHLQGQERISTETGDALQS
jgi:hypothetical protein